MSIIDDNREYVAMGVTDDANLTPTPLKVDPVTGRLIISLTQRTETPVANTVLPVDENRTPVAEVVTNSNLVTAVSSTPIKGGVIRVIDSATGDIARTTSGAIEDVKYGWYLLNVVSGASAEFDSAVTRTGRLTVKVSTTDASGRARASTSSSSGGTVPAIGEQKNLIPCKPSTSYKISVYAKTNNVATNSVYLYIKSIKADLSIAGTTDQSSNKISGTNDWTLLTKTFTTASDIVWLRLELYNDVAGNISDAWFDVNSMTLEEVSTITNAGATPALFYPRVTAVTSTDNIDQSDVTSNADSSFGDAAARTKTGKLFTASKTKETGFVFRRSTSVGTFVGTVKIAIQLAPSNVPDGNDLYSKTYSNADWEALTADTDVTLMYPSTLSLTAGSVYAIVCTPSTVDGSNYPRMRCNSASGGRLSYNGSVWAAPASNNGYCFKTLYSKNTTNFTVRTDTQTLSYTAPTPDGWANGTVLDAKLLGLTPLTLAAGVNNIYYSSNGPATADGTVDPSLQMTLAGEYNNYYNPATSSTDTIRPLQTDTNGLLEIDLTVE